MLLSLCVCRLLWTAVRTATTSTDTGARCSKENIHPSLLVVLLLAKEDVIHGQPEHFGALDAVVRRMKLFAHKGDAPLTQSHAGGVGVVPTRKPNSRRASTAAAPAAPPPTMTKCRGSTSFFHDAGMPSGCLLDDLNFSTSPVTNTLPFRMLTWYA